MRRMLRRSAALLAAYALALQAMLSLALVVPVAAAPQLALCQAADGGVPTLPLHGTCDACLAGHCAGTAAPIARVALATPWRRVVAAGTRPSAATRKIGTPAQHAHGARAPPHA
jgi:hypothetical protein